MKDRIIKFLTHEGISSTRFADEIGVQRSSVSHILSGRNNPGFDFIQKILLRYKHINADWLITGNGNMVKRAEQQSLFGNVFSEPPKSTIENTPVSTDTSSIQPTQSAILSSPEADKKNPPVPLEEISASRQVEKVLIFYTDKTFEEYHPSK